MTKFTLTIPNGLVATTSHSHGRWFIKSINPQPQTFCMDDLQAMGCISNDGWDSTISGKPNGSTGYMFKSSSNTGTLCATSDAQPFVIGQDVTHIIAQLTNSFGADLSDVICFTPGTLIETVYGDQPIEFLQPGDQVITADNGLQTIRWVGTKTISGARLYAKPDMLPVMIKKGALGHDLPERDMWVSPKHRMNITATVANIFMRNPEALVQAKSLVNDDSIFVDTDVRSVTYVHILFDKHEIIRANGSLSESFYPGYGALRTLDEMAQRELIQLFPDLTQNPIAFGDHARPDLDADGVANMAIA